MNEVKIQVPEGMEIDKENSTFELIKFKKKENVLPRKWEDIRNIKGYYISGACEINHSSSLVAIDSHRSTLPTEELAEAMLALCQLIYLRDVYNDGWIPNFGNSQYKYGFAVSNGKIQPYEYESLNYVLLFKTSELRNLFFTNFKDLLEIAKPLL